MIAPSLKALSLLSPLLLAACMGATGPGPHGPRPGAIVTSPAPEYAPRGDFRSAMIDGHNRARADFGVAPLQWDAQLAADAQDYARELARTGRFAHSSDAQRRGGVQGENLWMGSRDAYTYRTMVGDWVEERAWFKPGVFPDNSTTGNWADVAHYTAIVWPETRAVGCATASNARFDYLVCRYFPAGNVQGVRLAPRR